MAGSKGLRWNGTDSIAAIDKGLPFLVVYAAFSPAGLGDKTIGGNSIAW